MISKARAGRTDMLQQLAVVFLKNYLGNFVEGLDNTKLGLNKGVIKLQNVQLKANALDFLELPVDVNHGSSCKRKSVSVCV